MTAAAAPLRGLKLVTAARRSLTNGELDYTPGGWREAPGNGCYLAVSGGLDSGGDGPLLAIVDGREPTGAKAPGGVVCVRKYRVLRVVEAAPLWAEYDRQHAPLLAEYERQRAPLLAEYERQRAPLLAEHARQRAPLLAEYDRQHAALWAELMARAESAPEAA